MKKIILLLLIAFAVTLFAGPKEDVLNSLKIMELTRILDLNEKQIASLIHMENRIRELHEKEFIQQDEFLRDIEKKIEKGDYSDVEGIISKSEQLEQSRMDEMHKLRKEFMAKLSDEMKLRYIVFEFRFRDRIKKHFINKKQFNNKIE